MACAGKEKPCSITIGIDLGIFSSVQYLWTKSGNQGHGEGRELPLREHPLFSRYRAGGFIFRTSELQSLISSHLPNILTWMAKSISKAFQTKFLIFPQAPVPPTVFPNPTVSSSILPDVKPKALESSLTLLLFSYSIPNLLRNSVGLTFKM